VRVRTRLSEGGRRTLGAHPGQVPSGRFSGVSDARYLSPHSRRALDQDGQGAKPGGGGDAAGGKVTARCDDRRRKVASR